MYIRALSRLGRGIAWRAIVVLANPPAKKKEKKEEKKPPDSDVQIKVMELTRERDGDLHGPQRARFLGARRESAEATITARCREPHQPGTLGGPRSEREGGLSAQSTSGEWAEAGEALFQSPVVSARDWTRVFCCIARTHAGGRTDDHDPIMCVCVCDAAGDLH